MRGCMNRRTSGTRSCLLAGQQVWRVHSTFLWLMRGRLCREASAAARRAEVECTTYLYRSGILCSTALACPNRRRPLAEPARSSSYGLEDAFRCTPGRREAAQDPLYQAPDRCPGLRQRRRSVGFDSPWGRPSGTSSTTSSRRSEVRITPQTMPALPSRPPVSTY